MIKKKDHAMLEEAYSKVLMNEIHAEFPEYEDESEDSGSDKIKALIAAISGASEVGDKESLKRNVEELNRHLNGGSSDDNDLDFETEEPQTMGGNEGTGKYISNKEKSAQHKNDFLINRMNLKPGKDF
jgi:hypothetical protein